MTDTDLENFYREHLEEDIIADLSEKLHITLDRAMDKYYRSALADRIHDGEYGIQYLDNHVLADMIINQK